MLFSVRQIPLANLYPVRWYSKKPVKLKAKSHSSQEWLRRQMTDPYVEKAKMLNYRCRSYAKLCEIDDKYKILRPGYAVIDCGAAPGSWSQVAVRRCNADGSHTDQRQGIVIGIDLLPIFPFKGATFLGKSNFTHESTQKRITELLNGAKINCVLSDMAPNATGVRQLDQENIMMLCNSVLDFALKMSAPKANLLVKIWDNGDAPKFIKKLETHYETVRTIKPMSSRDDSMEKFILARSLKETTVAGEESDNPPEPSTNNNSASGSLSK